MKSTFAQFHLLKHPFYRAWEDGSLPRESLQRYAREYYHHVSAFPRYLSAAHSQVEELPLRQVLLENLIDEEQGPENHPELWLRFAEGMGLSRAEVKSGQPDAAVAHVIQTFMSLCRSSKAEGLGALYAYESQIPEIAEFKLKSLKKFYLSPSDAAAWKFFEVHQKADVYHTQSLEAVLSSLSEAEQARAQAAMLQASQALWGFLDAMSA